MTVCIVRRNKSMKSRAERMKKPIERLMRREGGRGEVKMQKRRRRK
jgi:hypothetical protein